MQKKYSPPFSIGSKTLKLVAGICEMIGDLVYGERAAELLRLRKINQLKTVQDSLAIEGNTLSIEQITAVIAGKNDCRPFIDFMLEIILCAVKDRAIYQVTPEVTPEVAKMLRHLQQPLSRSEIMHRLGLSDEKHFRDFYLHAAMSAGLIEMTVPDKPRSRLQKYRLTKNGRLKVR